MAAARMGVRGKGQPSLAPSQRAEVPERERRFGITMRTAHFRVSKRQDTPTGTLRSAKLRVITSGCGRLQHRR